MARTSLFRFLPLAAVLVVGLSFAPAARAAGRPTGRPESPAPGWIFAGDPFDFLRHLLESAWEAAGSSMDPMGHS
jgi:hypothetical protein